MLKKNRKFLILIFTILLISLACVPPGYIYDSVDKIYIYKGRIFLSISEINGYMGNIQNEVPKILYSDNEGKSWGSYTENNDEIKSALLQRKIKEVQVCTHHDPPTCFRISGQEEIQVSTDGGKSWKVDWDETRGRKSFLDRDTFIRNNKSGAETIPMDIGLLEGIDQYKLFVTMGTQGILVRDMNGNYQKYSVTKDNKPLSVRTTTFENLIDTITSELYIICIVSLFHFLIASVFIWRSLFRFCTGETKIRLDRINSLLWLSVWLFICSLIVTSAFNVMTHMLKAGFEPLYVGVVPITLWSITFISILFSWILIIKKTATLKFNKQFVISALFFSGLIIPICVVPFVLWATGIVTQYEVALCLSVILGLVIFILNGFTQKNTFQVLAKYSD
jgi:hypothetical protein